MASDTRKVPMRIRGGPPADLHEWTGIYNPRENPAVDIKASGIPDLDENMSLASIYGSDEFPLFGPKYGLFSRNKSPRTILGSNQNTIQETLQSGNGMTSRSIEEKSTINTPIFTYGNYEIPEFGPRYGGISTFSSREDPLCTSSASIEKNAESSNSPQMQQSHPLSHQRTEITKSAQTTPASLIHLKEPAPVTSCAVCTEDLSATIRLPKRISQNCLHPPSTCGNCLATCIKIDLETKTWNQIKCPECSILLIYEDIRQLADPDTFTRYEMLSFRSALSEDDEFVWCQNCDFGQLHTTGETQPIVRCLNCGFRTCYRHSIPWHDQLTCEEYDEMLQDPDNFQSAIEKDEAAAMISKKRQEEDDEALARSMTEKEAQNERARQRQIYEDHQRREREEEDEKVARRMMEKEREAEQNRQRQRHEENLQRARKQQEAEARAMRAALEAQKREAIKRRQKEEKMSLQTVEATTKPCPGCRWPIEKNKGCSHMTCTQCRHEFCWNCLRDWNNHGSCRR